MLANYIEPILFITTNIIIPIFFVIVVIYFLKNKSLLNLLFMISCFFMSFGFFVQDLLVAFKIERPMALDDFLSINPCFDDLSYMLSCRSADELLRNIEKINSFDKESIDSVMDKQKQFVGKIFKPLDRETIKKDLLC